MKEDKPKLLTDFDDPMASYESQFSAYKLWLDENAHVGLFQPPLSSTSHLLCLTLYHGTNSCRLFFPHTSSLQLQAYCDATEASDSSDRRSLSTFYVFLRGSLIAWKTKKHTTISCLSIEVELRAMVLVTEEATQYVSIQLEFEGVLEAYTCVLVVFCLICSPCCT
jgi:hypothetical protein